jgi:hypothetical protein
MVYSYSTNALLADIVDLTSPEGAGRSLPIIWSSYIGGPGSGNVYYDVQRMKSAVDQAFVQSPYLAKTNE